MALIVLIQFFFFLRAGLPRKPHHRPQLQHVLFPSFTLILFPKFLRKCLAPINVLRANKINCDLDTVGNIRNLGKEEC
jgi:hypothetical protein